MGGILYCQLGDYMLPIPPFTFEREKIRWFFVGRSCPNSFQRDPRCSRKRRAPLMRLPLMLYSKASYKSKVLGWQSKDPGECPTEKKKNVSLFRLIYQFHPFFFQLRVDFIIQKEHNRDVGSYGSIPCIFFHCSIISYRSTIVVVWLFTFLHCIGCI